MDKKRAVKTVLLVFICLAIFLLVYTPHYNYPFPRHIDEWHHIEEALKIGQNKYTGGSTGLEYGFHLILFYVSKVINLVSIYYLLPALWAVLSALVLFYVVRKKTNWKIAIYSLLFFAFIKSNVNLGGLWFFTPLTFAIPFIYLYIYFFTEGLDNQNKKYLLSSLAIMLFLIPIHSISLLFSLPFLTIYALIHYKYLLKEWKFFSLFLLIPITGILFYKFFIILPKGQLISHIINSLQFKHGWGVAELNNSPLQIYSLTGLILALGGIISILAFKIYRKKFLPYILWPIWLSLMIICFRLTGVSYLSPYQRNVYYLALSLPFLSAIGLYQLINLKNKFIQGDLNEKRREKIKKITTSMIIILTLVFISLSYFNIENNIALYRIMTPEANTALNYLATLPDGKVICPPNLSPAVYPISLHRPLASSYFIGNITILANFYATKNCAVMNKIIKKYNSTYILSTYPINCNWSLVYNKNLKIYKAR